MYQTIHRLQIRRKDEYFDDSFPPTVLSLAVPSVISVHFQTSNRRGRAHPFHGILSARRLYSLDRNLRMVIMREMRCFLSWKNLTGVPCKDPRYTVE
jgi:hypothetical protein